MLLHSPACLLINSQENTCKKQQNWTFLFVMMIKLPDLVLEKHSGLSYIVASMEIVGDVSVVNFNKIHISFTVNAQWMFEGVQ